MKRFLFTAAEEMHTHLKRVTAGEYDVKGIKFLSPPTVLDIGANIGAYSFWVSQRWPGAKIHAYEPNMDNVQQYITNMLRNDVPNTHIDRAAVVSTTATEVTLFTGNNCGMHSVHKTLAGTQHNGETFTAPVVHPAQLPAAHIIKLDIEGPEFEVLEAYLRSHTMLPTLISYEFHSVDVRLKLEDLLRADFTLGTASILYMTIGTCNWVNKNVFASNLAGAKMLGLL